MRPIKQTLDALGNAPWIPVNFRTNDFGVGIGVNVSSGGVLTYSIQHTFDLVSDAVSVSIARITTVATVTFDDPHVTRHYRRTPLTVSVSLDGYTFTKAFALRCGAQEYRVPDVKGRGGGGQYPDALIHNGELHVLYSMGKEDIAFSSVRLVNLELS